jgi:hypothetical protein
MGIIKRRAGKLLFFALLLFPFFLPAQGDSLKTESSLPILNNHYFIPNSGFPSPFITTFFSTTIGGGSSLTSIPVTLIEQGLEGTVKAEDTFITANLDVQIKVKEWMSAWFSYQASARIGTSTPTILAHGVASVTSFQFGWLLRAWRNQKNILSVVLGITNSTITSTNILTYIGDIVEAPDSLHTSISQKKNPLSGVVGLRYAHAFNGTWGLKAFLNVLYGESIIKQNENILKFDTGIMGSVNFNKRYGVPMGINLGYSIRKFALFEDNPEDKTEYLILELAYTHLKHYNMGLNFSYILSETPLIKDVKNLEFFSTAFVLNYYF